VISEEDLDCWRAGTNAHGDFLPTGNSPGKQWFYYSSGKIAGFEGVMAFESHLARAKGCNLINPSSNANEDFKLTKGDTVRVTVDMNKRQISFDTIRLRGDN
jgi:hypothetical protein